MKSGWERREGRRQCGKRKKTKERKKWGKNGENEAEKTINVRTSRRRDQEQTEAINKQ
jgi:hypothetical protein